MKDWLVILTKFESGTHWILLVRAWTQTGAKKQAMDEFGKTQGDLAYAFEMGDLQKRLVVQMQETGSRVLEIVDI